MKYYFRTSSAGKCGCSNSTWKVTENFDTKKALKNRFSNAKEIYTEEQLEAKYKAASDLIKNRAMVW